jgi:hypothetical protein
VFGDARMTTNLLDRLAHHRHIHESHIHETANNGFRFETSSAATKARKEKAPA